MILIADTSPIISLILADEFDLLEKIFGEFYIPNSVWEEIKSHNEIQSYSSSLNKLSYKIKHVQNYVLEFGGIDIGETEAIMLYKEINANLLLIDDKRAREVAQLLNVKCIGTLAILLEAKRRGLIKNLNPIFRLFINKKRHYSKKLMNEVLELANENHL
jgi:predicted nucleic acid-binding protein